jgi:biopolymer transport protein ExbD
MKRISNRQTLRLINEISISPLLILLMVVPLVFVMAAPLLKKDKAAVAPRPAASAVLAIAHDQTITLDGEVVQQKALLETLKQRVTHQPGLGVVVKIDHKLPVQNLVEVMSLLKSAGVALTAVAPTTADPKS